jgi:hypothetical protein
LIDAVHHIARGKWSVKDTIVDHHDSRVLDLMVYRKTVAAGFDEILLGSVASIKTTVLLFAGVRCEIIQDTFSSANLSLELYW